jgi:hypothetical protein
MGQRRGVKFEVAGAKLGLKKDGQVAAPQPTAEAGGDASRRGTGQAHVNGEVATKSAADSRKARKWTPGHCADCLEPFVEWEVETLVGFACGHVFHLTHLLARLHPGEEVDELVLNGVAEQRATATHLIGAKVTHARLLRDRIAGGCPVCVNREEDG